MTETTVALVKAYQNGRALALTVPKLLRDNQSISSQDRFFVKLDSQNRLVYEKVNEGGEPSPNVTKKVYPPPPTPSRNGQEARS